MTLRRTRIGTSPDVARIGEALARPGMDPRIWSSLAIVTAVNVDTAEGAVFVDVTLLPSLIPDCARVGAEYAGNGWGLYAPIYVDDEVLVVAPSGDPDEGLVVTRRMHSPSDQLPGVVGANPNDFILVVQPGSNLRVITSQSSGSGGDVNETIAGNQNTSVSGTATISTPTLNLGGSPAVHPAILGDLQKDADDAEDAAIVTANTDAGTSFVSDNVNFLNDYTTFLNLYTTYSGEMGSAQYSDLATVTQGLYQHIQNLESHVTNLETLVAAMVSAAQGHTDARAAVLSVTSQFNK